MLVSTDKGLRHNEGKVKVELVPPRWVLALAEVLTKGAEKYAERNWEKGMEWSKCYSSAQRHLLAFWDGEDNDKETGLPHVAHAAWNCLALLTYSEQQPGLDDRPGTTNADRIGALTASQVQALASESDLGFHTSLTKRPCPELGVHGYHTWTIRSEYIKDKVLDYWCSGRRIDIRNRKGMDRSYG